MFACLFVFLLVCAYLFSFVCVSVCLLACCLLIVHVSTYFILYLSVNVCHSETAREFIIRYLTLDLLDSKKMLPYFTCSYNSVGP